MTYGNLLNKGRALLEEAGLTEARIDAELLLLYVSEQTRSFLFVHKNDECSEDAQNQYLALIERRKAGEPVQYITGSQEFMGLDFEVNPSVLIPRQDTEILVEAAIEAAGVIESADTLCILDMCCGSGAIAVSMAHYLPHSRVTACDISPEALKTAAANAVQNSVEERICFLQGDLFAALDGTGCGDKGGDDRKIFDLILCNPPYIPTGVIPSLQREITEHEPFTALDGGDDGLDFYRILAEESQRYLNAGGHLLMEIGYDQADDVCALLEKQKDSGEMCYTEIQVLQDLAGLDRVVHCVRV